MNADVSLKLGAYLMSINENGTPEFGNADVKEFNLTYEEVEKMVLAAPNFDDLYPKLRDFGVNLDMEDSKVFLIPVTNGTVIFFNDGAVQEKLVLDKELTPAVALQIREAKDREDLEGILIQNNVIERPEQEMENEVTVGGRLEDVDRAGNVNDMRENNSAIAQNRYARYNDPERRKVSEMDGMDR